MPGRAGPPELPAWPGPPVLAPGAPPERAVGPAGRLPARLPRLPGCCAPSAPPSPGRPWPPWPGTRPEGGAPSAPVPPLRPGPPQGPTGRGGGGTGLPVWESKGRRKPGGGGMGLPVIGETAPGGPRRRAGGAGPRSAGGELATACPAEATVEPGAGVGELRAERATAAGPASAPSVARPAPGAACRGAAPPTWPPPAWAPTACVPVTCLALAGMVWPSGSGALGLAAAGMVWPSGSGALGWTTPGGGVALLVALLSAPRATVGDAGAAA